MITSNLIPTRKDTCCGSVGAPPILRTLGNNYVVIPNSTLAKATITNYSVPETHMSYTLPVSVAYGTDPNQVEKVLLEAAHEAMRDGLEGLLAKPEPSVSFIPGFGDSSLNFSLGMQVRQFTDQFPVQSELRKRIVKKFQEAGINMPFPTRTLVLDKSTQDLLSGGSKVSARWAPPDVPPCLVIPARGKR